MNTDILKNATILIVDDQPDHLKLLATILQQCGTTILSAISGDLALNIVKKQAPDLILLDIIMPGMSGFEVCQKLKAEPETKHIPIIFISSLKSTESVIQGFKIGGADYITKPFQPDEVLARISTHLTIRRETQQRIRAQKALSESEESYRSLVNVSPTGIVVHRENEIIYINPRANKILGGKSDHDFIGKSFLQFIHPDYHDIVRKRTAQLSNQQRFAGFIEIKLINLAGQVLEIEIAASKMHYQGESVYQRVFNDITHRKTLERKLNLIEDQIKATLSQRQQKEIFDQLERQLQELEKLSWNLANEKEINQIRMCIKDLSMIHQSLRFKPEQDEINMYGFLIQLIHSYPSLTRMEINICSLIRLNLTSDEIAAVNHISKRTVDNHRYHIHLKMNLTNGQKISTVLAAIPV